MIHAPLMESSQCHGVHFSTTRSHFFIHTHTHKKNSSCPPEKVKNRGTIGENAAGLIL